jgi:hypothetical protein
LWAQVVLVVQIPIQVIPLEPTVVIQVYSVKLLWAEVAVLHYKTHQTMLKVPQVDQVADQIELQQVALAQADKVQQVVLVQLQAIWVLVVVAEQAEQAQQAQEPQAVMAEQVLHQHSLVLQ